jgi:hypothetical protein
MTAYCAVLRSAPLETGFAWLILTTLVNERPFPRVAAGVMRMDIHHVLRIVQAGPRKPPQIDFRFSGSMNAKVRK